MPVNFKVISPKHSQFLSLSIAMSPTARVGDRHYLPSYTPPCLAVPTCRVLGSLPCYLMLCALLSIIITACRRPRVVPQWRNRLGDLPTGQSTNCPVHSILPRLRNAHARRHYYIVVKWRRLPRRASSGHAMPYLLSAERTSTKVYCLDLAFLPPSEHLQSLSNVLIVFQYLPIEDKKNDKVLQLTTTIYPSPRPDNRSQYTCLVRRALRAIFMHVVHDVYLGMHASCMRVWLYAATHARGRRGGGGRSNNMVVVVVIFTFVIFVSCVQYILLWCHHARACTGR